VTAAPAKPVKVFYSYAHKDADLRERLKTHVSGLESRGLISEWHDGEISPGTEWNEEILKQLDSADVILLLISSDFINSRYSNKVEVKKAIERHKEGTARVIPVILRPVNWNGLPFSNLQALPSGARPVTTWPNEDEAFLDVANGIETAISELNTLSSLTSIKTETPHLSPLSYIESQSAVDFVPRKDREGNDILERLRAELAPGSSRLLALWGAGGVGKTALAAEAARSLIGDYKQRVVWINADGRDQFSFTTLLDEVAIQLARPELRTFSVEVKKGAIQNVVRESPSLIVFDNFETVGPKEQSQCLEWLSHISPSSALVTTRARIEVLAVRNLPIASMSTSEAIEFLERLIQQAQYRRNFEGVDKQRIIETAEANPLILQWVFAQIDLAQDWHEVLNELAQGEGDAAHRVFDRSFGLPLLNKGGRAALLALSLFVPSASRSALAEVAGLGDHKDKKFKDAIKHLAALWLIRTTESGTRLTVEGLTRDLAKARLNSDPRRTSFHQRFGIRFHKFADANSDDSASSLNALDGEKQNLLAAIEIATAIKSWNVAFNIYGNIKYFLYLRGHWDDAISLGEKVMVVALANNNKATCFSVADNLAAIQVERGEYEAAEQNYNNALDLARDVNSHWNIAVILYNFGRLQSRKGNFRKARELFQESLDIRKQLQDLGKLALSQYALADIEYLEGNVHQALRLYEPSRQMLERFGTQLDVVAASGHLPRLYLVLGQFETANEILLNTLEISKKLTQIGTAVSLNSLSELALEQGHTDVALKFANESLQASKSLGSQINIAAALQSLGKVAYELGKRTEARQFFEDSLEIRRHVGSPLEVAFGVYQLGNLDLDEGELTSAEILLDHSLNIFQGCNARIFIPECLETIGRLNAAQAAFDNARALYLEALQSADAMDYRFRIASIKHSLGLLAEKENKLPDAADLLQEALRLFHPLNQSRVQKVKLDLERVKAAATV
jgi:tetratricopeptide (TPR) repeat protein